MWDDPEEVEWTTTPLEAALERYRGQTECAKKGGDTSRMVVSKALFLASTQEGTQGFEYFTETQHNEDSIAQAVQGIENERSGKRRDMMGAHARQELQPRQQEHPKALEEKDVNAEGSSLFTTGKGQAVYISEGAQARAANLLRIDETPTPSATPSAGEGGGGGGGAPFLFTTGKGAPLEIGAEARARVARIFADSDDDEKEQPAAKGTSLFTTGKGQAVYISEGAKARAANLLEDPNRDAPPPSAAGGGGGAPSLFTTGKGARLEIGAEARARAARIFADSDDDEKEQPNRNDETPSAGEGEGGAGGGGAPSLFTTGKGAPLEIGAEARARVARIFADSDEDEKEEPNRDDETPTPSAGEGGGGAPFLFTTGKGASLEIGDEARARVARIFADSDDDEMEEPAADVPSHFKSSDTSPLGINDEADAGRDRCAIGACKNEAQSSGAPPPLNTRIQDESAVRKGPVPGEEKVANDSPLADVEAGGVAPIRQESPFDKYKSDAKSLKRAKRLGLGDFFPLMRGAHCQSLRDGSVPENWGTYLPDHANTTVFFREHLLQMGASDTFVTHDWVENHCKLIVWKLLSYNTRGDGSENFLTVENMLRQLWTRHDVEVNYAWRSTLRRIMEGDSSPMRPMVLCIADIISKKQNVDHDPCYVLVTDGWYFLRARLDTPLEDQLNAGRIYPGLKIKVSHSGVDGDVGVAPFSDGARALCLNLHYNATRRAPWDKKLGFIVKESKIMRVPLSDVKADGGTVPATLLIVKRMFPVLYYERLSEGTSMWRNESLELAAAQEFHDKQREKAEEKIAATHSESEVPDAMAYLKEMEPETERKSTPLLQFMVGCVKPHGSVSDRDNALISIWRPPDILADIVREGQILEVTSLVVGPDSSIHSGLGKKLLSFSTSKMTRWNALMHPVGSTELSHSYQPRSSLPLSDLCWDLVGYDFDTTGIVVHRTDGQQKKHKFERWTFLTDASVSQKEGGARILAVREESFQPFKECRTDNFGLVWYQNLVLDCYDSTNKMWLCVADKLALSGTGMSRVPLSLNSKAEDDMDWVLSDDKHAHSEYLATLRDKIVALT